MFSDRFDKLMCEKQITNTQLYEMFVTILDNPPSKTTIGNWRKGAIPCRHEYKEALFRVFGEDAYDLFKEKTLADYSTQELLAEIERRCK